MQKLKSISILLVIVLFSCTSGNGDDFETLKKKVMDAHDEVMPKMGTLRKTAKELTEKSLGNSDSLMLMESAMKISTANDNMMNWMRGFDPNFGESEAEKIDYLKKELVKIEKVRDDMNATLTAGKKLLNQ